ncbi:MAG: hypothetical protein LBD06_03370 [Candidatus Accumulibacter sp.]|nr:hypothetical protein [Accumulibacter sp.]
MEPALSHDPRGAIPASGDRFEKTEKPSARFFVLTRREAPRPEDRGLRRQRTDKPIARFFLPDPARSAQARGQRLEKAEDR